VDNVEQELVEKLCRCKPENDCAFSRILRM